jgi:hypothetical protein
MEALDDRVLRGIGFRHPDAHTERQHPRRAWSVFRRQALEEIVRAGDESEQPGCGRHSCAWPVPRCTQSMWQSPNWNGQRAAFRFYETMLVVLVYVAQPDHELNPGRSDSVT